MKNFKLKIHSLHLCTCTTLGRRRPPGRRLFDLASKQADAERVVSSRAESVGYNLAIAPG